MNMKLTVCSSGKTKEYTLGGKTRLFDALKESDAVFSAPCGGRGICGGCAVRAIGGLSEPSEEEKAFLGERLKDGLRLACFAYITDDCFVFIDGQELTDTDFRIGKSKISPVTGEKKCIACAVDIGTTSVAFCAISLPDGKTVLRRTFINPQTVFGADVLTRITAAQNGHLNEMKKKLDELFAIFSSELPIAPEYFVITGNTAMLHIASGRDPSPLGVSPFRPETLFGFWDGNRYYMPCVSAFIGADTVCAVMSNRLSDDGSALMCDIGTNNEMALWNGNKLYCCSSPAGPAFEGASISRGMSATEGAIVSVSDNNGKPVCRVAGNGNARGICGSGLIDACAFLLDNNYLAPDGSIIRPFPDFDNISLTAHDIAELQLAKSAVISGMKTLCKKAGTELDDVKKMFLCGSFGSYISAKSAERIGMIPKGFSDKCILSGNSALSGACMALLDEDFMHEATGLSERMEFIELADTDDFTDAFISNMLFPE